MAFEGLTEKLSATFKKLRGKGRLKESDVKEAMREVRLALLEADVNYKVAKEFTAKVSERAVGQDVMESLTPAQMVVKIVNEELTNLMGGLESIHPNTHVIERELDENWEVLGEPIQTAMRACELAGLPGMDKPYEKVKELMRGHTINKEQVEQFIDQQSFDPETAARLKALTPATYTGVASQLVAFGR